VTLLELPAKAYHADAIHDELPSLSAGIAKLLISRSAAHAFDAHPRLNPAVLERKPEEKAHFDMGTAIHALVLEGTDVVQVCAYDDWRTKEARAMRDEARAQGLIPLLDKQWTEVLPALQALKMQLDHHTVRPVPFTNGEPELTMVWEEDGYPMRARLDFLHDDRSTIDDLKTTEGSARPDAWARTMYGFGGDVQVAFYLRGARAHGWEPQFRFVVMETRPPFAVTINALAPDALAIAEDKVDWAIRAWKTCLETGSWPGYTPRVAVLEAPAWAEAEWLELRDAA
jgi:hypothetical protein